MDYTLTVEDYGQMGYEFPANLPPVCLVCDASYTRLGEEGEI